MLVTLNKVCKGFAGQEVLKNINLSIQENDRIGLLGVNGVGKTTLLNIITGTLPGDTGEVSVKRDLSIGYLRQNEALRLENTLQEEIEDAIKEVYSLRAQMRENEQKIAVANPQSAEYQSLTKTYEQLSNAYEALDGYHADVRVQTVLNGLGFGNFDLQGRVQTLSGGEKIRFSMVKVLLKNPELLILDEPTNHLDFSMLSWLEDYLTGYRGAVVVVSHDRYFLDKVSKDICEIEFGELVRYKGGYTSFLRQKEERVKTLEKEYKKQQVELEQMREYVRRNLAKSSSTNSVGSRVKALEKMELAQKPNPRQKEVHFRFDYDPEPHKVVLSLQNVGVHVGNSVSGKQLFDGVNLEILRGEKIALVGQNGIGKSSLLKAILKKLPYTGTIRLGGNVRVSYFDQELSNLNLNDTVLEAVHKRFPSKTEFEIRSALGKLLIEDEQVFKRIRELSGANRAKVAFCIIQFERGNFLILDEPTNHLDYIAKEALDKALKEYTGTLLVVSHDRYFLNSVPQKIAELESDGIHVYQGGYDDYLAAHETENGKVKTAEKEEKPDSEQKVAYEAAKKNKSEERKRRAKLSLLQKEIEEGYRQVSAWKAECEEPDVASNFAKLSELLEQIETAQTEIEEKENEWLSLSED